MNRQMPKQAVLGILAVLLASGAVFASCTGDGKPDTQTDEDSQYEKSRADAALTWSATSEQDRTQICEDLDTYGWDWTRDQMSAGAPAQSRDATNWDTVVAYFVERCGERI